MGEFDYKMQEFPDITILVAGDFMLDRYLYSEVSRISPEAPVPVAKVLNSEQKLGGAGNVALNIRALGSQVRILTCIGQDENGRELLAELTASGADVSCIYRDAQRKTSRKTRIVAQNQQLLRCDEEEVADASQNFLQYLWQNAKAIFSGINGVVLSDYGKGILMPEICQFIIQQAKERGLPVLVDPKGNDYNKYAGATICTPNLKELTEAGGLKVLDTEEKIQKAALSLCSQMKMPYLLATRSDKGMSLVSLTEGTKQDFPAVIQEVCDVTGAGDTVVSTMAVCMVAGYTLPLCCRIANAAASVVVAKFGAATASVEEINNAIATSIKRGRGGKVCSKEEAVKYAYQLRQNGKQIVFTNGCFDLVHAGHIASFRKARSLGDVLIVGINDDGSVRRLKGDSRPIVTLQDRVRLLEALEMVDCIVPFSDDTPQSLIEAIRPDILVKGRDWEGKTVAGEEVLRKYGGKVIFVDLEEGLSTTAIVEKIQAASR